MEKKHKIGITLGTLGVVMILFGVTFAFFNYTRTGVSNVIKVGKISFESEQTNTITLLDVFPIDATDVNTSSHVGTGTINITGDTTYDDGVEYVLTISNLTNTVGSKEIPIDVMVTASNLGDPEEDYFNERGGETSIYKVLSTGTISNNKQLLVGYITKGSTGVDGTVTIKAYLDKDKIAISDTYPEEDITHTEGEEPNQTTVTDYTNGTTEEWVDGRIVLTTSEWNELQANGISFQVKVEANEGVWVEGPLTGEQKVRKAITAKVNAETNSCNPVWIDDNGTANDESDDITYFSGTNDCVDMNYVWYSGKLWRITAIYPDGAMKLVTQNNITTIAFNASWQKNFYTNTSTTSYIYQWLNEDFYDTLYHASDFIDTEKYWNASIQDNTIISTIPGNDTLVSTNVGLLNSYEYYNSYRCIGSSTCTGSINDIGYLNIGYSWWLLNPCGSGIVWNVFDDGVGYCDSYGNNPSNLFGVRPSIIIKSRLEFTGDGTSSSPYKIVGDKEMGIINEPVNTRLSGEYIKLKNGNNEQVFRIIEIEDNKAKIIAMDYAENKNTRKFATSTGTVNTLWGSGTTTDANTWYTYLNAPTIGYFDTLKTTYGDIFDSGLYYLGTSERNYKLGVCANTTSGKTSVCDKTNDKGTFNIGMPRYGEMFATQQGSGSSNSIYIWLINRYNESKVWFLGDSGGDFHNPTYAHGARPTVHLKSTVKILSGSGTESDPYVVGL